MEEFEEVRRVPRRRKPGGRRRRQETADAADQWMRAMFREEDAAGHDLRFGNGSVIEGGGDSVIKSVDGYEPLAPNPELF